jgi:hypothetical protein
MGAGIDRGQRLNSGCQGACYEPDSPTGANSPQALKCPNLVAGIAARRQGRALARFSFGRRADACDRRPDHALARHGREPIRRSARRHAFGTPAADRRARH